MNKLYLPYDIIYSIFLYCPTKEKLFIVEAVPRNYRIKLIQLVTSEHTERLCIKHRLNRTLNLLSKQNKLRNWTELLNYGYFGLLEKVYREAKPNKQKVKNILKIHCNRKNLEQVKWICTRFSINPLSIGNRLIRVLKQENTKIAEYLCSLKPKFECYSVFAELSEAMVAWAYDHQVINLENIVKFCDNRSLRSWADKYLSEEVLFQYLTFSNNYSFIPLPFVNHPRIEQDKELRKRLLIRALNEWNFIRPNCKYWQEIDSDFICSVYMKALMIRKHHRKDLTSLIKESPKVMLNQVYYYRNFDSVEFWYEQSRLDKLPVQILKFLLIDIDTSSNFCYWLMMKIINNIKRYYDDLITIWLEQGKQSVITYWVRLSSFEDFVLYVYERKITKLMEFIPIDRVKKK